MNKFLIRHIFRTFVRRLQLSTDTSSTNRGSAKKDEKKSQKGYDRRSDKYDKQSEKSEKQEKQEALGKL